MLLRGKLQADDILHGSLYALRPNDCLHIPIYTYEIPIQMTKMGSSFASRRDRRWRTSAGEKRGTGRCPGFPPDVPAEPATRLHMRPWPPGSQRSPTPTARTPYWASPVSHGE